MEGHCSLFFFRAVANSAQILRQSHVNTSSGFFFFLIKYYKMHLRFLESVQKTQNSWGILFCNDTNLQNVTSSLWHFPEGSFYAFFFFFATAMTLLSRILDICSSPPQKYKVIFLAYDTAFRRKKYLESSIFLYWVWPLASRSRSLSYVAVPNVSLPFRIS